MSIQHDLRGGFLGLLASVNLMAANCVQDGSKVIIVDPRTGARVAGGAPSPTNSLPSSFKRAPSAGTIPRVTPISSQSASLQSAAPTPPVRRGWQKFQKYTDNTGQNDCLSSTVSPPAPSASGPKETLGNPLPIWDIPITLELRRPGEVRVPVPLTWQFHSGDSLWIRLRSPVTGRVYVIEETAGYPPMLVIPNPDALAANEHVQTGQTVTLPSEAQPFEFDERSGNICVTIGFIPDSSVFSQLADQSGEAYAKGLVIRRNSLGSSTIDQTSSASSAVGCTVVLHQVPLNVAH